MLWTIARKEWLDAWRDRRVVYAGAALLMLVMASGIASRVEASRSEREFDAARHSMRQQWLDQGEKDPHLAAHYGVFALRPSSGPARLDPGLDPYAGTAIFLEAHRQNSPKYAAAADRTLLQRFGDLSLATALFLFAPLLVVLIAHGVVADERQNGTLALVLAQGVPPRVWLMGKVLGITAAVGFVTGTTAVVGALVRSPMFLLLEPGAMVRIAAMGVSLLVCITLWVLGAVVAPSRVRTPAAALAILLAWWIASALVVPRVVSGLAERAHPTPGAVQLAERTYADRLVMAAAGQPTSLEAYRANVLRQYGVSTLEELPVNFRGLQLQNSEENANVVWDRHFGALWQTYTNQERLRRWWSFVVPAMAARDVAMAAAGTNLAHHRAFADDAERYRREWVRTLNLALANNSRTGEQYRAGAELWASIPAFEPTERSLGWSLRGQRTAFAALGVWILGLSVLVWRARPSALERS